MEIKYMMLNQRVVPVEPFEAVSIGGRFDGGDLFKTGKYSCSSCGKDEWFFCPDQYAPFLACHTLESEAYMYKSLIDK